MTAPPAHARRPHGAAILIALALFVLPSGVGMAVTGGPLAAFGLSAAPAHAGTYTVSYCGTDGVAENWSAYATAPGTAGMECGAGSRIRATLSGTQTWGEGSTAFSSFTAPDNTTIAAWRPRLRYSATKYTESSERLTFTAGSATNPSVNCLNLECANGAWDEVAVPAGTRQLAARALCISYRPDFDSCKFNAEISDYGGTVTLQDDSPPTPRSGASGTLTQAASPRTAAVGVADANVLVDDKGSGVQGVALRIDGATVATGPGCSAQPTTKVVPCPLTQDARISFDTRNVADGGHTATLVATDASGNETTLWNERIYVANTPIGPGSPDELRGNPTGAGATDDARLTASWPATAKRPSKKCKRADFRRRNRQACTSRPASSLWKGGYAQKSVATVTGRVTNKTTKAVIPGATVVLTATPIRGGDAPIQLTTTANENGRYRFTLPRNRGSHNVTIGYIARQNDARPAATATARQLVRATLTLRVNRRSVRSGRSVSFTARLRDGAAGVPAVLEVYAAGKWRTFAASSTKEGGRFRASYRFVGGRGSYRFRARARPTRSTPWPYLGAPSRVVSVRVR